MILRLIYIHRKVIVQPNKGRVAQKISLASALVLNKAMNTYMLFFYSALLIKFI